MDDRVTGRRAWATHEAVTDPQPVDRRTPKMVIGAGFFTGFAWLAPPVMALVWAGLAVLLATLVLVQQRPGRGGAIVVLVFAGVAALWAVANL